ncbi:2-keto-4-pentenoate hydratase/2-oxohepta-3-ene-1,7-dioic acid hydratase in catechol pathway [Streptomyces sp. SAI-135]|uniref:fumarylacetoacetate hydrolase family protein n=1 Tax=unclassified Streptomyces TaxID=2593676 RepID=UPI002475CC9E|nr:MULTISPECIES: fumarylacetoacetate hydrolase family protein [unclassified Streptomyces]MDH6523152.1 2-keto-4-pentenoate hydratase/2-oxohepta-3-ene-1,7-dioic acid hydratase in catechol pathway [Streptomyces sp. SAI-090]MDH6574037.1 2-keto-4-pentenoate hydratase/2-oxohepta-3-ene-1,7-dioic acid hydratase in catechol pathway [Streptomyces sp. SAI-117]MDH6581227.1 2-keto-4-pentenoate hydratase/2-oxohepta-3-ene-1,7-dioic acid hydratase in catechol pathway [Streptomyces sp. SAI-133]MDH6613234.1 2-ke
MRFAVISGRLHQVVSPGRVIDLHTASGGTVPADPQQAYACWDEVLAFAGSTRPEDAYEVAEETYGNPVPQPRQVFAIGLNYADHAAESDFAVPESPPVFTKFVTSLTGPFGDIAVPPGDVDWEVELVVVIGRRGHRVAAEDAWSHVAGVSVGQDISERVLQKSGPAPQFSLGKSHPGFGPIGPVLVTPDELPDRDDLELGCLINGEQLQKGHTRDMVFPVPELIARLSAVTPLLPGDVIFTGTPSGVGLGRTPPRWLQAGDELVSYVRGVGEMRHRMVAPTP